MNPQELRELIYKKSNKISAIFILKYNDVNHYYSFITEWLNDIERHNKCIQCIDIDVDEKLYYKAAILHELVDIYSRKLR